MAESKKLYTAESIESLSPLEFTRLRPGVYAGDCTYSTQLLVEILSNAIDEFNLGHGNEIDIYIEGDKVRVRDYGQGFIVVDQVPTRLIDDAIKNTNYKIVHRLTAPDDQEVMASCMAFRDDQKYIIPALEKGNAIICGDEDDAAAWVRIPAPKHI